MLYKSESMQSPVANEMRDQAAILRQQGMMPSSAMGAGDGSGNPINQQSFASPAAQSVIGGKGGPSLPTPSPMYVPGLGTLGPDAGGWLKGVQAAQDMQLKAAGNTRAEEELGLNKAKFGLAKDYFNLAQADLGIKLDAASQQRQKFDIDMNLMDGMTQAADQGGYTGVIDYLKTANPAMAVEFHQKKLNLDDSIMKNDILKHVAPNMKTQAMFDAYAAGGKLAAGLMRLPPEQREAAFKAAVPMFQKIDPDFPNKFGPDAVSKMELMLFQGTPENVMFANSQMAGQAQSQMGKLTQAYEATAARYGVDSKQAQDVLMEMESKRASYQQASMAATKAKMDLSTQQVDAVAKLSTMTKTAVEGLNKDAEPYLKAMGDKANALRTAQEVMDMRLKGVPIGDTAAARQLLAFSSAKANAGAGTMSDQDFKNAQIDFGFGAWDNNLKSYLSGKNVKLSDDALFQLSALQITSAKRMQKEQMAREDSYRKMYSNFTIKDENGKDVPAIQWEDLPKPSQKFAQVLGDEKDGGNKQYPQVSPNDILYIQKHPTVENMKKFQQTYGTNNLFRYIGND